ncbi:MAG: FAD-dependent monooxygenase [Myxococcales bacterium]|nr:FAD-dependent monooxygenase [Myxococcales bacterium]
MRQSREDVVVVGGGPVGLVCALLLENQGYRVRVYESRPDPRRSAALTFGRSISLTLTSRGWRALRSAGVEDHVRRLAFPLRGRTIHLEGGRTQFHAYGPNGESIESVMRDEFVRVLVDAAERRTGIELLFEHRCLGLTPDLERIRFTSAAQTETTISVERVIAADGINSAIRRSFIDTEGFDQSTRYSRHFYRELSLVGPNPDEWPLDPGSLHLWPREDVLLVAFPNQQRRFTGTLFMPMDGPRSFHAVHRPALLQQLFENTFSDLVELTPRRNAEFFGGAPWALGSTTCSPWTFREKIALVGDAAHAMVPFLGQGLNAGLEDVTTLTNTLEELDWNWAEALHAYPDRRKPDCDAVTALAEEHYRELAQESRSPEFVLKKRIEARLIELFPDRFSTPYAVISFTERPYREVHEVAKLQERIVSRLMELPDVADLLGRSSFEEELRAMATPLLWPR